MDARRLGHSIALPHALLEDAAAACLSDAEWDNLDEDWLKQALAWATQRCRGVAGLLTRIRPRPGGPAPRLRADRSLETGGPAYRLADYLDQHGRTDRGDQIPPPGFWAAAARAGKSPGPCSASRLACRAGHAASAPSATAGP